MTRKSNNRAKEVIISFIDSVPQRAKKIRRLSTALINNAWDANTAKKLFSEVHNLRGLSGHQGLLNINEIATETENIIEYIRNNDREMSAKQKKT